MRPLGGGASQTGRLARAKALRCIPGDQCRWNPMSMLLNKIYKCQGAAGCSLHSCTRDVLLCSSNFRAVHVPPGECWR